MNLQTITYWVIGVVVVIAIVVGGWFFLTSSPSSSTQNIPSQSGFGVGDTRDVTVLPTASTGGENTPITTQQSKEKIFKVVDGPVTTATLIQTFHPTTTLARFVLQENGHVLDLVLDNAGLVPRAVSNTTIPGTARGGWASGGGSVILQYLESSTVKTLYVGLPVATTSASSTKTQAIQIKFLPDNIIDFGISPDGKSLAYLLSTSVGSDGYSAKIDGTNGKKLFSTPLSELLLSWPSLSTLLLQTKSSAGATGAAFSVSASSGTVSPLVYAPGLTSIADTAFARVVYQRRGTDTSSYVHDVKFGKDKALSFNPIPEKCAWSKTQSSILYCAAPLQYIAPSYLDEWHQGVSSVPDVLFSYNVVSGQNIILAAPGSDGGVPSDIAELAVSPDDHYLLFIKKGDRSLWGVRLTQ